MTKRKSLEAGFDTLEALLKDLNKWGGGDVYRISLKFEGDDPRIKLRSKAAIKGEEKEALKMKVSRLDKASKNGPWVLNFLCLLKEIPGVASKDLFARTQFDQHAFKLNVRKLKNLGLTISLGTGYKLAPRGKGF